MDLMDGMNQEQLNIINEEHYNNSSSAHDAYLKYLDWKDDMVGIMAKHFKLPESEIEENFEDFHEFYKEQHNECFILGEDHEY
jgi:hypothetical protein